MCLPANPLPPNGGGGDPAEHGRGGGAPPGPEEMLQIIERLLRGSEDEAADSIRQLRTLAFCPAHAHVILETPGAVAALVAVMKGDRDPPLPGNPGAVAALVADVLRGFADPDLHLPPLGQAGRWQEYIRAVVGAGGVEGAVEFMSTVLEQQSPGGAAELAATTFPITLLGHLALSEPSLSAGRFEAMLPAVARVLKQSGGSELASNPDYAGIYEFLARLCITSICNMVECHLPAEVAFANRTLARELGCIEEIVQAMERNMGSQNLLVASLVALFHFANVGKDERVIEQRNEAAKVLLDCKGFDAVIRAMRAYPHDPSLSEKGCGIFFRYGQCQGVRVATAALEGGGVQCVLEAMQSFPDDIVVQTMGCKALWNLAHHDKEIIRTISLEMGGVRAVLKALGRFPDNELLVEMALGALWNPLGIRDESICKELAELGGIELIGKALLQHKDVEDIQNEGFSPLDFASHSDSLEVKVAFLEAPSAVPALVQVLNSIPPWWMPQLMTWELVSKHERVSNAIGRLGLMEVNMMGDDEFDGDNEEDEWCPVQDAPFDVGVLLDKDLADGDDVPGWFKAFPFHLDREHSVKCDNEQGGDKKILHPYAVPVIGDYVCLRVKIPFGGRGHLFGTVTGIGPLPTDEDLASNGSRLFGKGCPCSKPECRFRDASTREQLLAACGTLHGHEITCLASLDVGREFGVGEKLRHPPLVPFFRGEEAKYRLTLRFDERGSWVVVQISLGGGE